MFLKWVTKTQNYLHESQHLARDEGGRKRGGRVRVRVVAMETGGSVRSMRRRHHSAPFAPVRSCLSRRRPPLRSHTEHENFIQKFPLYSRNGPDYFLEEEEEEEEDDDESILAEQNNAKLWGNEKTLKKK